MRTGKAGRPIGTLTLACVLSAACSPGDRPPAPGAGQSPSPPQAVRDRGSDPGAAQDVVAEGLPYAEVGEELVYGHFVIPADMIDPLPAVIVVHDWWGLNDDVRALAEKLAGEGYIVLAVDLFAGRTADTVSAARQLEIEAIEEPERLRSNLGQAISFIRESSGAPSLAIAGFGFGGGWALNTALERPDRLSAAVSYYGQVITDEEDLGEVRVPFLGFYLESDRAVPIDSVREFRALMEGVSNDVDIRTYSEGRRGYMDRTSGNYDDRLADETWQRMLAFLDTHMAESP